MTSGSRARRSSLGAAALLAAGLLLMGCPGGKGDGGDSAAAAVKDTSQPQPNLPSAVDSARAADSSGAARGTVRDTGQPQPRLPGSGDAAKASGTKSGTSTGGAAKSTSGSGGAGRVTTAEDDTTRIRRLEAEARALAKVTGCNESDQCRTAPVGHRPCGGPRTYLPYCALTTDSAALFRKLEQLAAAERDYNAKRGIGSTCDFRSPPPVEAASGTCHLRTAQPGAGRVQRP